MGKIYCDKCDSIFDSKEKFDEHFEEHYGITCESCPVDLVVQKFASLFRRKK